MYKNTHEGKFIVFEGLDGSGTTTQVRLLKEWLEKEGQPVYITHEPSEGPVGQLIKLALGGRLKSLSNNNMDDKTLALFFAADRLDHLQNILLPHLKKGIHVISDRYYLSSLAYQSLTVDVEWIGQINSQCLIPDLTIMLDVPVAVCKKRMSKERWHVELYEDEDKLEKVRENYLSILRKLQLQGQTIVTLDGNILIKEVHKKVKKLTNQLIKDSLFLPIPKDIPSNKNQLTFFKGNSNSGGGVEQNIKRAERTN